MHLWKSPPPKRDVCILDRMIEHLLQRRINKLKRFSGVFAGMYMEQKTIRSIHVFQVDLVTWLQFVKLLLPKILPNLTRYNTHHISECISQLALSLLPDWGSVENIKSAKSWFTANDVISFQAYSSFHLSRYLDAEWWQWFLDLCTQLAYLCLLLLRQLARCTSYLVC